MRKPTISKQLIRETINFHGHSCPGLALGIRAAELALAQLGRASDDEITAVVETDMCGVDAIQFLMGCTFGNGNLIHLDYGKNVFSFYRRSDGKAIRVMVKKETLRDQEDELRALRKKGAQEKLGPKEERRLKDAMVGKTKRIMAASLAELFEIKPLSGPMPKRARILDSLTCEACGEATMESRTRRFSGQTLCIPCFEARERRQ